MSGWEVGDLALCIEPNGFFDDATGMNSLGPDPVLKGIYQVTGLVMEESMPCLVFEEFPGDWYDPRCFRKIKPDAHEGCEPEFVTLLKHSKKRIDA